MSGVHVVPESSAKRETGGVGAAIGVVMQPKETIDVKSATRAAPGHERPIEPLSMVTAPTPMPRP